ncbi:MAG: CHASE2 domain-containing protein, partial [Thermodesulfobacteriota bacterium]
MFKKNPALWLAILLSVVFLVLSIMEVGFIESLELTTYDLRMKLRATSPGQGTDITIVDIDDDSIDKLGRWPWPRSMIAEMVHKLNEQGAKIIGLIIFYSEPQVDEGLKVIEALKAEFTAKFGGGYNPEAQDFIRKLDEAEVSLDHDGKLAQALEEGRNVVLPVYFEAGP